MEISPPETFIAFLQAIIEAETQADLWKAKLFCNSYIIQTSLHKRSLSSSMIIIQPELRKKISVNYMKILLVLSL